MFGVSPALAEDGNQGLTLSPPLIEINLSEGQTVEQKIKLSNPTKNNIELVPKVMDFRAENDTGEPAFYTSTREDEKFALSRWIIAQMGTVLF